MSESKNITSLQIGQKKIRLDKKPALFSNVGFSIVGTPTIKNGILSNTSDSSYLKLNNFCFNMRLPWEIQFKVRHPTWVCTQGDLSRLNGFKFLSILDTNNNWITCLYILAHDNVTNDGASATDEFAPCLWYTNPNEKAVYAYSKSSEYNSPITQQEAGVIKRSLQNQWIYCIYKHDGKGNFRCELRDKDYEQVLQTWRRDTSDNIAVSSLPAGSIVNATVGYSNNAYYNNYGFEIDLKESYIIQYSSWTC